MNKMSPYQIFFPLGLLGAILAVGVWLVQGLNWFSAPALFIHGKLIVGGFLWSFIIGFLMTAVPRMTGTAGANRIEYLISLFLMSCMMLFSWTVDGRFFYGAQIALILFILTYAGRRTLKSTKQVPVFFSHVGIAMFLALAGAFAHFKGQSFLGIHLYHVGTILLLVLGIGTRFFSFLSGLLSEFENQGERWKNWVFHGLGAATGVFLFLGGKGISIAYLGLTIVSLVYLFFFWKVQRPSSRPSPLKWGARLAAVSIPLSFLMSWLQPAMFIAWFHLLFIGCFGVITFAVATRVTLAHGAYPIDLEVNSPSLWWVLAMLSLGALSRVAYGYADGLWKAGFLHLAAALWILGVGFWCSSFLIRIFKPGPMARPSC